MRRDAGREGRPRGEILGQKKSAQPLTFAFSLTTGCANRAERFRSENGEQRAAAMSACQVHVRLQHLRPLSTAKAASARRVVESPGAETEGDLL